LNSFLGAAFENNNASLISLINDAKDITIFAPNNAAMEMVAGSLTSRSEDDLKKLLSYHIVVNEKGGPYYSAQLGNSTTLKTLQGNQIAVSFASNSLFVNSARILTTDLLISGGVVHVIDNVLSPESTAASPNPSLATQSPVLETAGGNTNSSDAPFTSFVPDVTALAAGATGTADSGSYTGPSRSRTSTPARATQTAATGAAASIGRLNVGFGLVITAFAWLLIDTSI
jgi:transforming growth factor-beta-induced protein